MIDRKELLHLFDELERAGAKVTGLKFGGDLVSVRVTGIEGFPSHGMSPLAFGETAREWLCKNRQQS